MKSRLLAVPPITVLAILILLLTGLAWINRAVFDDAFISYRYAQHLTEGHGLVFNIGETPVEGYTNFLWTLLMSLPFILSLDPVVFSWIISLICFIITLVFTYRLATEWIGNPHWGILAVFLLGTNYTFSVFATSGLETQCQAMLISIAVYATFRYRLSQHAHARQLFGISIIFSLLLLLRLDSAIFVGILGLAICLHILRGSDPVRRKFLSIVTLGLPVTLIVSLWLIWKLTFYGDVLPNTFYIKVSGQLFVYVRGIFYLLGFWLSYWLFPFPFIIGWTLFRSKVGYFYKLISTILMIWTLYLLYVGGDHMEFRFMVPVLPLLMILIVTTLTKYTYRKPVVFVLITLIAVGSISHYFTFPSSPFSSHQNSIQNMRAQHDESSVAWDTIGKMMGEAFDYDRSVTIALNPAGIIPYYSQARTVDMLGLNDKWVAEHGIPYTTVAAHEIVAPFDYLITQGVNLHIEQPIMISRSEQHQYRIDDMNHFLMDIPLDMLSEEAVFLVMPINDTHELLMIYLKPHPAIDTAIETYGWKTYPIIPS